MVSQIAQTWWMKKTAVRVFVALILQRAGHIFRILWSRTNRFENILYGQKGIVILCFLFTPWHQFLFFFNLLSSGVHIPGFLLSPCSLQPSLFPMFLLHIFMLLFLLFHKLSNWGRRPAWLIRGLLEIGTKNYIYTHVWYLEMRSSFTGRLYTCSSETFICMEKIIKMKAQLELTLVSDNEECF